MSKENKNKNHNSVNDADIEFVNLLAAVDDERDSKELFIHPSSIFKVYIEESFKDYVEDDEYFDDENEFMDDSLEREESLKEITYDVYVNVDGIYSAISSHSSEKEAKRAAENFCIKFEKYLRKKALNALEIISKAKEEKGDSHE